MSGYLRSKPFETKFDGDTVTARLKPLLFEDVIKYGSPKDEAEGLDLFRRLLPKYVEDFSGLKDAEGAPIGLEEVIGSLYFAALVAELGAALFEAARVQNPPQPASPSAS